MTEESIPLDLRAEAFFLADHAAVENGKLYVNGGYWTRLNHPAYPAVQTFSIALVLHVPWRAHHQGHKFGISFEDADGHKFGPHLEGQFQAGTAPDMRAGDFSLFPVAVQVNSLQLPQPGDYSAVLEVDKTEVSRWRFRAVQVFGMPAQPPQAGAGPEAIAGPQTS